MITGNNNYGYGQPVFYNYNPEPTEPKINESEQNQN